MVVNRRCWGMQIDVNQSGSLSREEVLELLRRQGVDNAGGGEGLEPAYLDATLDAYLTM